MAGADFDSVGRPLVIDFDTLEEVTEIVPADQLWEVYAIAFKWLTTADVGNRAVEIRLANRFGQVIFRRQSQLTQVANEAIGYVWAPGMPDESVVAGGDQLLQPMPLLQIEGGGRVVISDANGIAVLDALIGSISLRVYKGD